MSESYFVDIACPRRTIERSRVDYNRVRPQRALENPSPGAFAERAAENVSLGRL